jgi:geranylgeranyl diphosphate synthase type II
LGGDWECSMPAGCAVELIHTYSLIHDDLPAMDNDTLRRGRPTLHVVYGDGIAILAGDGLHAEAFALLAREPAGQDPEIVARKLRVLQVVGDAARSTGLVGGQAIDLQAAGQAPGHAVTLDADGLRAMHARKTGALIRASAVSGAIMGGGDEPIVDAIDRYAADLGLAFQIVDDILDVEGSAHELGKTAGKDATATKPTYPALFGLDRSRSLASECIGRAKQTLLDARLTQGWLAAIADWAVSRRH